jgi:ArsR family metal-binding transcriptional regulator
MPTENCSKCGANSGMRFALTFDMLPTTLEKNALQLLELIDG